MRLWTEPAIVLAVELCLLKSRSIDAGRREGASWEEKVGESTGEGVDAGLTDGRLGLVLNDWRGRRAAVDDGDGPGCRIVTEGQM